MKNLIYTLPFMLAFALPFAHAEERKSEDILTEQFARARKEQVKSVAYGLNFKLEKGSKIFHGTAQIEVGLKQIDRPLSLDFSGREITRLNVNGQPLSDYVKRVGSFDIPAKYLRSENSLVIEYSGEFGGSHSSFFRYVDPADQREYLYTDFEPYQAHSLFPCFDQPDLKASFTVHVTAPNSWKVISNALPVKTVVRDGIKQVDFGTLIPISTYLFFLGAGDFHEWSDLKGKVPLYLYARESLAKHIDAQNIFSLTQKGLYFYTEYLHQPYPFTKFGQIFIPDFNWGGMENPGAITLNEKHIFTGKSTFGERSDRMNLILHEMAHMWFGDFVTLKWWNDTWLNEAFATYMSTLAQSEALKDPSAWSILLNEKSSSYHQDLLVGAHPVEIPIVDTQRAQVSFDDITYGKGPAALQQLSKYVGAENFRLGLIAYFKKYGGGNAERINFTDEIAKASKKDLKTWSDAWIRSSGPNRVTVNVQCKNGKVSLFQLRQEANASGILAPHRTQVGLFAVDKDHHLKPLAQEAVIYEKGSTDVSSFVGQTCPDFTYPNVGDQDYAVFNLDPVSMKNMRAAIAELPDPLTRFSLWENLGVALLESKISPAKYLEVAQAGLKQEKDEVVIGNILGHYGSLAGNYSSYPDADQRRKIAPQFEDLIWSRIAELPRGSSLQLTFYDFVVKIAQTPKSMQKLRDLLDGRLKIAGIELDQERRWNALIAMAYANFPGIAARIKNESKRDHSGRGRDLSYAVPVAIPELARKQKVWPDLFNPEILAFDTFSEAAGMFQDANHPELELPFVASYFTQIRTLDWSKSVHIDRLHHYFSDLFPHICTAELHQQSEAEFDKAKSLPDVVVRAWAEQNDLLERCIRARTL